MIADYLEKYTFDYLIDSALDRIPDTIDKREGSIIYDALAPACFELANYYLELGRLLNNTYAATAVDEFLDLKVAEQGLTRYDSSFAERKGVFTNNLDLPMNIPLGARFSSVTDTEEEAITFVVIREVEEGVAGEYVLQSEKKGTIGNQYVGTIIPITFIQNLKTAYVSEVLTPGRNSETDEELRSRYLQILQTKSFGGNVTQYDQMIRDISGVGEVQVYPVWNGGGTVLLSVIDTSYLPIDETFRNFIKNEVDPDEFTGEGMGLAPIGHEVTVSTPETYIVNFSFNLDLAQGYGIEQIRPYVISTLENYFTDLRKSWGVADDENKYSVAIYIAKINSILLNIEGIANVTGTTINNTEVDLIIDQTAEDNKLPILGEVAINDD